MPGGWATAFIHGRRFHVKLNNVNIVARNAHIYANGLFIDDSNTIEIKNSVIEVYQYNQIGTTQNAIYINDSSNIYLDDLRLKTAAGMDGRGVVVTNGSDRIYMHSLNVSIWTNNASARENNTGILVNSAKKNIFLYSSYIDSPQGTVITCRNNSNIVISGTTLRYGDFSGLVPPVSLSGSGTATCVGSTKIHDPYGNITISPIAANCQ